MNGERCDIHPAAVSDQDLNAWVDGELVGPECGQVAEAMMASPEVAARVCELQTLKMLVQLAYAANTAEGHTPARRRRTRSRG